MKSDKGRIVNDPASCLSDEPLLFNVEVKHVEQVADGRHVLRYIRLSALIRIGQVIAAAITESSVEHPVPLDEFHERGVLVVSVVDMAAR